MDKLSFIGLIFGSASSLVVLTTFLFAYFNQDKLVYVTINRFGEANLELFIVVMGFILAMYHLYKRCTS